ncbi:hypothetical protein [Pararhodospirillum oryzae]|uniref:Uncharacterized protein n=1 Tax=Pararhodospirillum oryzae TaxID=478448 RepID=A0A512HA08_9PROT|nr:hypothetical protein [Pararhodospirillum oryzae]GEO82291.1 hypothetical protein ROR02_24220 [Pararhodospirillum oryzae]
MIQLTGSPKQVSWATEIRGAVVPRLLALAGSDAERAYAELLLAQATPATWWIDNRRAEPEPLAWRLRSDWGRWVSAPAPVAVPDPAALPLLARDPVALAAAARAAIERVPGYRYSSQALTERLAVGLRPGDTWRSGRKRVSYLGHGRVLVERLGVYDVALESDAKELPAHDLEEMLALIAREAAKAAVKE